MSNAKLVQKNKCIIKNTLNIWFDWLHQMTNKFPKQKTQQQN